MEKQLISQTLHKFWKWVMIRWVSPPSHTDHGASFSSLDQVDNAKAKKRQPRRCFHSPCRLRRHIKYEGRLSTSNRWANRTNHPATPIVTHTQPKILAKGRIGRKRTDAKRYVRWPVISAMHWTTTTTSVPITCLSVMTVWQMRGKVGKSITNRREDEFFGLIWFNINNWIVHKCSNSPMIQMELVKAFPSASYQFHENASSLWS